MPSTQFLDVFNVLKSSSFEVDFISGNSKESFGAKLRVRGWVIHFIN